MPRDFGEPTGPDRNVESFISDGVEQAHKRIDSINNRLKLPTIPIYDSNNFPDEAVDGQLARDVNNLDTLWQFQSSESGGDDEWHMVGQPKDFFARYFTINMAESPLFTANADHTVNWKDTAIGTPAHGTFSTNDTTDGSIFNDTADHAFTSGAVFGYDPAFPTKISGRPSGIYLIQGGIDLRGAGNNIPSPYNFFFMTGPDANLIAQPYYISKHEVNTQADTSLHLEFMSMQVQPTLVPATSIGLSFRHSYSSSLHVKASLTITWMGPVLANFEL